MNQFKWDQKVKAEREANKAKKAALVAKLTGAPEPTPAPYWIDWTDVKSIDFKLNAPSTITVNIPKIMPSFDSVSISFDGSFWTMGSYREHPTVRALAEIVPAIRTARAECPACPEGARTPQNIATVIVGLNDQHKWTREQIADWLDMLPIDLTIQPKGQQENADTNTPDKDELAKAALDIYAAYGLTDKGVTDAYNLTGIAS